MVRKSLLYKDLYYGMIFMRTKTSYRTKKPAETEIGKSKVDRIVESRQFEPEYREEPKREFRLFRWKGDQIEGILGAPITNFRRNTSYPITLDDGRTVEIFGNKLLHELIRKHELIGSKVRIVYIGRQQIPRCRPRKIYRVFKITGVFTESKTELHAKPKKKRAKK